jgi:hypothetical protein
VFVAAHLADLPPPQWERAVRLWARFLAPARAGTDQTGRSASAMHRGLADAPRTFRVTVLSYKQSFTVGGQATDRNRLGQEVATALAGRFGWQPELTKYDAEVCLHVRQGSVTASLSLSAAALSITHAERAAERTMTMLRPSIAYALVWLGCSQPGDVVLDPCCGGGTIVRVAQVPNAETAPQSLARLGFYDCMNRRSLARGGASVATCRPSPSAAPVRTTAVRAVFSLACMPA